MCDGNIIISPFSAQTVMTLLYVGADGKTARDLQKGLFLGSATKTQAANEFQTVLQQFQGNNAVQSANAIYVMKGYRIKPHYKSIVTEQFYAAIESVNFANNIPSAKMINDFVANKTHDKIQNLISADSLNADTRLVLVNAIYFNGTWKYQFKSTTNSEFYSSGMCNSGTSTVGQTKMMHVTVSIVVNRLTYIFIYLMQYFRNVSIGTIQLCI